jgi:magnesium transporter
MNQANKEITQNMKSDYFKLFPIEAAHTLNDLSSDEILESFQAESKQVLVRVFSHLDPDVAANLVARMDEDLFVSLFGLIDPGAGVKILSRLDQKEIENQLSVLPQNLKKEYTELLSYPPDTAGYLMDPKVTFFYPKETIEKVLQKIRALGDLRVINLNVVNADHELIGVIRLQEVAISQPSQRLEELIKGSPIAVEAFTPKEDIVKILNEKNLVTLPVVDINHRLIGVIRNETLVDAARQDASEDVQAMFGAGRDERALSSAFFSIRKRLPWLEINLITAFIAAAVVGLFEDTIAKITILAVFLPVVAGQSGNTGSQALAVTIRGLALREIRLRHWFKVTRKETIVGFVNGLAVALSTAVVVYIWGDSFGLSIVIGVAMVFSMVIAGLSGAIIPIILTAIGQDPAQSSSIILTTVTDVAGFLSFLGLAALLADVLNIA